MIKSLFEWIFVKTMSLLFFEVKGSYSSLFDDLIHVKCILLGNREI